MSMRIRMAAMVVVIQCVSIGSPSAAPPIAAKSIFGPADIAAIAGNGRLTIAVNRSGRLTACRWPSPGYFEHIAYTTRSRSEPLLGVEPWHGAGWAIQLEDQLVWSYDDRWTHHLVSSGSSGAIEIESVLGGHDVRMRQQFAVTKGGNAFVARVTVSGDFDNPPSAYWYANFSPSTRIIPSLPIVTNGIDDFASFIDPNLETICHFRPHDPSSYLWRIARGLTSSSTDVKDWMAFPEGSYVVYGSGNAINGMAVGPEQGPASVVNQINAGTLSKQHSLTGQTASAIAIELTPGDDGYTATVVTAFGINYAETAQRYVEASQGTFDTPRKTGGVEESDTDIVMRRAMATIRSCTDAATGSVVRAPTNTPPLAIDWPRYGVWIAMAHNAAEDHESAKRILRFYASHVRTQMRDDLPPGSIPAALYTNGTEAAPSAIVDAAAAGRVLWAMERHGSLLNSAQRQKFYRGVWDSVNGIADFLVQWREPGGRAPLYTFDYESMRDRRTTELYVASYLGVHAANRIANAINEKRPDWRQAADELRSALRLHALRANGEIAIPNPGMLYDTQVLPQSDLFNWPDRIRQFLRDSGGRLDTRSLEHLCKLVLSARNVPEGLRTEIVSGLRRHLERETPDSADAAFAYLIAHRLRSLELIPPRPIEELSPDTP